VAEFRGKEDEAQKFCDFILFLEYRANGADSPLETGEVPRRFSGSQGVLKDAGETIYVGPERRWDSRSFEASGGTWERARCSHAGLEVAWPDKPVRREP